MKFSLIVLVVALAFGISSKISAEEKSTVRVLLHYGYLLTPPSADELNYGISDQNESLDKYLDVSKAKNGFIGQFLWKKPSSALKYGFDFGFRKLFTSSFDMHSASNIDYLASHFWFDKETSTSINGIMEYQAENNPVFFQFGLGLNLVHWEFETSYLGGDSDSDTEVNFALLIGTGFNLRISENFHIPIMLRMENLFRYGFMLSTGIMAGFTINR